MAREATALRRLGPPITPALVHQGHTEDGRPFLAMEYLGEHSLARLLAQRNTIAIDELAPWFLAVCDAVERMHAAGIVHRDLKPSNIMIRHDGRVTIIDLGLAQLAARASADPESHLTSPLTSPHEWLGTYHYMAPEQWQSSRDVDARSDIYALGVIAFELLTGRRPFEGDVATVRSAHMSRRCPAPSALEPPWAADPTIDRTAIDATVLSCLAKDPAERFARCADLAISFRLAIQRRAARASAPAPAAAQPRDRPRQRPIVLLSVHSNAPVMQMSALASAHDAVIAHAEGQQYVFAFPWEQAAAHALHVALRVADAMERTGSAVMHIAPLTARPAKRGVRLAGRALATIHTWAAPGLAVQGVLVTGDMARVLGPGATMPTDAGYHRLVPRQLAQVTSDPERLPLYGRAELLHALAAEVAACVHERAPTLCTIEGEVGLGKTRVLHALAVQSRASQPGRVVYTRARPTDDPDSLYCEITREVLGLEPGSQSMDDLERAWADSGAELDPAERWAMAFLLGAASRGTPELEPILRAPGALRQVAARALASTLLHAARTRPLLLLLDDMHAADHTTLDALERATMDAKPCALGIWVTTKPSLFARRPRWGDRAVRSTRHALVPLDADHARAMLAELLRPVEFVPEAVLDRLHRAAGGVPLYLAELARAARDSGATRQRTGPRGTTVEQPTYYLAGDELLVATKAPVAEHLARQMLDALPEPLVPLAQLCALIGPELTVGDIRGIQAALHDSPEDFDIDPAFGLSRLCPAGLLKPSAHGYVLRLPFLAQALVDLTPPMRRVTFHAAVLRDWQTRNRARDSDSGRMAHHAAQCGETELAATIYMQLARDARDRHRYLEAEELATRALDYLPADDPRRGPVLAARGSVRYRLHRHDDALADVRQARALAEARADEADILALLLEECTILDWLHDWARADTLAREIWPRAQALGHPLLMAGGDLALGRACIRDESRPIQDAIQHLERAVARAAELGDHDIRVMALPILGPTLLRAGRLDDARRCYDDLFELCRRTGDDFHLAVAHLSRQLLWLHCQELDRNIADLEATATLGRQLGNAQFERAATFNLAEYYYWSGNFDKAYELAQRARDLYLRFMSAHPTFEDHLLLARILCSRGDLDARVYLGWVEQNCAIDALPRSAQLLLTLVRMTIACLQGAAFDHAAWTELSRDADAHAPFQEHVEVMAMTIDILMRKGAMDEARAWLTRARTRASSLWDRRLQEVARALGVPWS